MVRKSVFIWVVLFVFVFASVSVASERAERMLSVAGGTFAGMYGAVGEIVFHLSQERFNTDSLYLRLGLSVTDSKNLSPAQDWRRFMPICIDGVYYLSSNVYAGGGINYPLKVSDSDTGDFGYQAFVGADFKGASRGGIYTELGYSIIRRLNKDPFAGINFVAGWRYDLIPGMPSKKTKEVIKTVAPKVKAPVKEVTRIKITKQNLVNSKAEIDGVKEELAKVGEYIDLLTVKIYDARRSNDIAKSLELKWLKEGALERARLLRTDMNEKSVKYETLKVLAGE